LPTVDHEGRAMPGAFGRASATAGAHVDASGRGRAETTQRFSDGQRQRYFMDDERMDLQALYAEAKHGGVRDMDETMAHNIARKRKYREDRDGEEEYDNDGGLELVEDGARSRGDRGKQAERHKAKQVADYKRATAATQKCTLCIDSPSRPKHLLVALGTAAYLMLPPTRRLVPGHCCIVPIQHCKAIRNCDETADQDIRNFKKCLIQMFRKQGREMIFMETAMGLHRFGRHAVIDCFPVDKESAEDAPIFFSKALKESESDWATHNSKACIDTTSKGLKGSIPENFPYFNVEFGLTGGYVHVIDEEEKFNPHIGRDVLIGVCDLPAERAHQRERAAPPAQQHREMSEFLKQWAPFDWTKQLE